MDNEKLIYVLLTVAIFNAILRPSLDSPITLFRLLIPFCIFVVYKIDSYVFSSLMKCSLVFIAIAFLQYMYAESLVYPYVSLFSFLHLVDFLIHYISIFIVVSLVYCLWFLNPCDFVDNMINYLSKIVKVCLLIYVPYIIIGGDPFSFCLFDNINNFGCVLAGGAFLVLVDNQTYKYWKWLYILIILIVLYINDSKLALFGVVFGIMLFLLHTFSSVLIRYKKILLYTLGGCVAYVFLLFFSSDVEINGYSVQGLVSIPIQYIVNGDFFESSDTSITYRANCIIGLFKIIFDSLGLGIGPGSSGLVLQDMLPNLDEKYGEGYISSHIWWLEIMADLGWIAIILMIKLYVNQIRHFLSFMGSRFQLFSQIVFISFPLWSMSASGLYTEYFSIILMTLSYIIYSNSVEQSEYCDYDLSLPV